MKKVAISILLATMAALPVTARAYDRYARGRTLYFRRCGPCFSMGWKWAPKPMSKPVHLKKMARTWTPAQVCTWMRTNTKKLVPPGCYPGRITTSEKLDILYYVKRKTEGPIHKPILQAVFRRYRHRVRLKRTTAGRKRSALRTYKNLKEMQRLRRHQNRRRARRRGNIQPTAGQSASKTGRAAR